MPRLLGPSGQHSKPRSARTAVSGAARFRPCGGCTSSPTSAAVGEISRSRALMRWLLALQGKPGAFGEGCDKERHAKRACEHYVQGFFALAPPTVRLAPVTFPNGKVFRAEPAARYALSCMALRAALRTGSGDRPSVDRHVRSLTALASGWTTWNGFFAPDSIVAGHARPGPCGAGAAARRSRARRARGQASGRRGRLAQRRSLSHAGGAARHGTARGARVGAPRRAGAHERQRADGTFGAWRSRSAR